MGLKEFMEKKKASEKQTRAASKKGWKVSTLNKSKQQRDSNKY